MVLEITKCNINYRRIECLLYCVTQIAVLRLPFFEKRYEWPKNGYAGGDGISLKERTAEQKFLYVP